MTTTIDDPTPALVSRLFALEQELIDDPFPVYRRMREDSPVIRASSVVTVSRYADVKAVFRDPRTFSSVRHFGSRVTARRAQLDPEQARKLDALVGHEGLWVSETDDPIHARLRRFVNTTFSAVRVAEMRTQVETITRELLDDVEQRADGRFELVQDFSFKLPLQVICKLFGATGPEIEQIRVWSEIIGQGLGTEYSNVDEAYDALQSFSAYVTDLIAQVRSGASGGPTTLLTELMAPDAEGQVLSDDDLVAMYIQLLFAGHETTTNLIANALIALHESPEQGRILRADPSLIRPSIDEFLRYCGSIHAVHRVAVSDCEINGFAIAKGESVRLLVAAANHDPSVFDDPDRLDVTRKNARQHVGLGFGIHTCLGQWLTRLESEVALTELFRRFPDLTVVGDYPMRRNLTLHGPEALHLTY
ncbi:MAG: cytochrome P450 [Aeromicrobium sp.]